jgi:hypothetical protein
MGYGKITSGLLVAVILSCGAFQANAMDVNNPTWNLGVSIGHVSRSGDTTFAFSQGTAATTGANVRRLSDAGSLYGLLFGADWMHNRALFGLGLTLDWQNTSDLEGFHMVVPNTNHGTEFSYERGLTLGFFGRVGYQVADYAIPYLKVGGQTSRDKMKFRDTVFAGGVLPAGTIDTTINDRVTALVLGAGLEIPTFVYNTSLRFEYNYVNPETVMMHTGYANVRSDVTYKPDEHVAKLSWVWNFH